MARRLTRYRWPNPLLILLLLLGLAFCSEHYPQLTSSAEAEDPVPHSASSGP